MRRAGFLLHPTSLPGRFGVGDLGPEAYRFVDWIALAGGSVWQVLPLCPTSFGNSPYGGAAVFAGNPLLVSPELLVEDGLLAPEAVRGAPRFRDGRVDYDAAIAWKEAVLRRAWEHVGRERTDVLAAVDAFAAAPEQSFWLEDWALFSALKSRHGGAHWSEWPEPLRLRDAVALAEARGELAPELAFHRFAQFLFFGQWERLHAHARRAGVLVLGDLPIYVADDCVDVWASPELFQLDAERRPTVISGVPPDYFSATGQRWGNPLYRWDTLAEQGYGWWIRRLQANLRLADLVRLDHFRGFAAFWELPADAPTGEPGRWVSGPSSALFRALRDALGTLPIVAEDLGMITPDVQALRRELGLPGMKVLQFAFGAADSDHLPHHHATDTVAYTGTHDNDTTVGWFAKAAPGERRRALELLGCAEQEVAPAMIRAAYGSVAEMAIVPVQDVLGLGSEGRMNTPASNAGNWTWRLLPGALRGEQARALRRLAELTGRLARAEPVAMPRSPYPPGYPVAAPAAPGSRSRRSRRG
jgi:4-alpha-glucanotransferase